MLKLKTILEDTVYQNINEEKLQEFDNFINSGEYILTKRLIYRGIKNNSAKDTDTDKFAEYTIRTDRHGRNTEKFSNDIINQYITNIKFTNFPSRSEILFCSLREDVARIFGTTHIIIPHRDNIIYSYDDDSYNVLLELESLYRRLKNLFDPDTKLNIDILHKFKETLTFEFIKMLVDSNGDSNKFDHIYFSKNHDEILKSVKKILIQLKYDEIQYRDIPGKENFEDILYKISSMIKRLNTYINKIIKIRNISTLDNIDSFEGYEIWITNGKYLLVEHDFYDEYLKIKGIE